ncbi:MAG: ANTAR domain-containing response regulator, partial [Eubacteriales bacterium]
NTASSVILLVGEKSFNETASRLETNGVMCLSKPVNASILSSAMRLASAMRARLKIAAKKTQKLEGRQDELRVVNHAKWVLISNLGMTESDAHKYIEKQAMDMRISKRDVAANIIKTYEN